ncbi:MAG: 50S ribosome-binding GTPase [Kineosporiaceae bacterium]|nr:50S ribosome-binding GTPase [Kineosporiaceae bacterium]MBK7621577.1 50S ribosome-binding GTPase [Kineosporiaceae bacterium]
MRLAGHVGSTGGGPDLATRAESLEQALTAGRDRLDPKAVTYARAVIDRTGERLRLGPHFTIVALVGATGSGKSTLFNALAGMDLAETGVRRPTTGRAMACVWGEDHAEPLLDWLEVPRRHRTRRETVLDADRESELHGLVLLDMPDHDSTQVAHRLEVDRLVELVDLLVWVVDPQKYADEALHHGYLKRLANHDGVMIVVLNQIDKLAPAEAETCKRDLRRLLDSDGLESVRLLVTSAIDGTGVDDLRKLLAEVVDVQGAVAARAAADMDRAARRLMQSVSTTEPEAKDLHGADELVGALAEAAGVPAVLDAVTTDYRRQAGKALGWPFIRWWRRLRPDPLRRLGLDTGAEGDLRQLASDPVPETTPSQTSRVELSVRQVVSGVAESLPRPWADSVRSVATRPEADLSGALDRSVAAVDLSLSRPGWWLALGAGQLVLAALTVVGFGWLAILGLLAFLGVDGVDTPYAAGLPLPTLLLLVGLVGGGLLTLVAWRATAVGAVRHRMGVAAQMREAVQDVAWSHVIAPIAEVLTEHRSVRESLQRAI